MGFAAALVIIALAQSFGVLLLGFVILFPASGAFVSLSQITLMDLEPARHEANMARWTLAGSVGAVAGPLAFAGASFLHWGWRPLFVAFAALTLMLLLIPHPRPQRDTPHGTARQSARVALAALGNREVIRWLTLLHIGDLVGDVFMGFLAVYFVDVVHVPVADAAFVVLVWTVVNLVGDALLVPLLDRVSGISYLRWSALVVLVVLPAMLLAPGLAIKLTLVGVLALARAGWYAIPQGRLYTAMQDNTGAALALSNVAGLVSGLFPLAIGLLAERLGLGTALWLCLLAPVAMVVGLRRPS